MNILVNIDVDDLARAEAFYTGSFGLSVSRRFGDDAVELGGASVPIYLLAKPAGSLAAPTATRERDYGRHWTPVHLDLVVEDIDVAVDRAVAHGAVLEKPVSDEPYGRLALLADPFGHGLCLLEFNDAGYDAIAGESDSPAKPPA